MFLRFCQILGIPSECAQSVLRMCSECVQGVSRVRSECVQSVLRVCSECVQGVFRVCSECVQSIFRVGCQDWLSRLVVKIVVIVSSSASSVSVFGIFFYDFPILLGKIYHCWISVEQNDQKYIIIGRAYKI